MAEAKARIDANPMLRLGRRVFCILRTLIEKEVLDANENTETICEYWSTNGILMRVL